MKPILITIILSFVSVVAFADTSNHCETVMVEGMSISFTNSHGSMTVTAGKGFERRYTWAGDTRTVTMYPRKKRWLGSLGMYNPGAFETGKLEPWVYHDGIKRFVVEEGQRHFTNTSEVSKWLASRSKFYDYVYNDQGLVVGLAFDRQPPSPDGPPGTLHVDVWQIYINGKKPQKLDGSKNACITVHYPPSYDMETVTPPSQPVENE
jgi:hypothetical protein